MTELASSVLPTLIVIAGAIAAAASNPKIGISFTIVTNILIGGLFLTSSFYDLAAVHCFFYAGCIPASLFIILNRSTRRGKLKSRPKAFKNWFGLTLYSALVLSLWISIQGQFAPAESFRWHTLALATTLIGAGGTIFRPGIISIINGMTLVSSSILLFFAPQTSYAQWSEVFAFAVIFGTSCWFLLIMFAFVVGRLKLKDAQSLTTNTFRILRG